MKQEWQIVDGTFCVECMGVHKIILLTSKACEVLCNKSIFLPVKSYITKKLPRRLNYSFSQCLE